MSTQDYQRALSDLVADPTLCLRVRREKDAALAGYELTTRERHRLQTVVRQPGMSVCCTLHRMNRLTPLATLLPLTAQLLGDEFVAVAEAFWRRQRSEMQYGTEVEAFRDDLVSLLDEDRLESPFLREVLEFEVALTRLRFREHQVGDEANRRQVEIVRFRHDPRQVLGELASGDLPHDPLALDCTVALYEDVGEIRMSILTRETGEGTLDP